MTMNYKLFSSRITIRIFKLVAFLKRGEREAYFVNTDATVKWEEGFNFRTISTFPRDRDIFRYIVGGSTLGRTPGLGCRTAYEGAYLAGRLAGTPRSAAEAAGLTGDRRLTGRGPTPTRTLAAPRCMSTVVNGVGFGGLKPPNNVLSVFFRARKLVGRKGVGAMYLIGNPSFCLQ